MKVKIAIVILLMLGLVFLAGCVDTTGNVVKDLEELERTLGEVDKATNGLEKCEQLSGIERDDCYLKAVVNERQDGSLCYQIYYSEMRNSCLQVANARGLVR